MSLVVICITILIFTWLIRDSRCEFTFKQGDTEVAAIMVYES
ncbi:Hok/Gef family protein [Rouxiella sp. Mn2063]